MHCRGTPFACKVASECSRQTLERSREGENMASGMTEFCEQVYPRVLLEMRSTQPFPEMRRGQESWVAGAEKRALRWLACRNGSALTV